MSSNSFVQSLIGSPQKIERKDKYLSKSSDWRVNLSRVMLTGVLKNQFYRSTQNAADEALKITPRAAKEDPTFLLKAVCYARILNMKGMVKVGLAALNGHADTTFLARESTRLAAVGLLSTFHPGQLLQFVELVRSKQLGRGFGSRPQKWVRAAMENWNVKRVEDYTLKYPKALNALVRLVHPRYNDERGGIVNYVLNKKSVRVTGSKQVVVEALKRDLNSSDASAKAAAKAILENDIPWDVIKGIGYKLTPELAMAQMVQMGLTALLLNVRSLEQHGAFSNLDGLKALQLKMGEVKNSRSLPLDFAKPYIFSSNESVKNVLLDAMVDTLDVPMPFLESKRVGLSIDISQSMSGEFLQTSALLAVPFLKAKNLWLTTFDWSLYEESGIVAKANLEGYGYYYQSCADKGKCPKINGLPRREQVRNLLGLKSAGGTDIAVSIRQATKDRRKLDLMVLITDEHQNLGTKLMDAWRQYRGTVNSGAQLFIINATNYEWGVCDYSDPSVTVYQSLTPAIFKNLEFLGIDIVSAIEDFDLANIRKRARINLR